MYSPFVKACNYAFHKLSEIKIRGLPDCNDERRCVLLRREKTAVVSEDPQQGSYSKSDLALVGWDFLNHVRGKSVPIEESYVTEVCCQVDDAKRFNWRHLRSTIEVKLCKHSAKGSRPNPKPGKDPTRDWSPKSVRLNNSSMTKECPSKPKGRPAAVSVDYPSDQLRASWSQSRDVQSTSVFYLYVSSVPVLTALAR